MDAFVPVHFTPFAINTAKSHTKTLEKYLQELPIRTGAILKPGLRVFSCYCSVEPGHFFMCSGGNELLQLRPLADDGLLQSCSLYTHMSYEPML